MGTTHNFDNPAASSCSLSDTIPTINAGTSRGATATLGQVLSAMSAVVSTTATSLSVTAALHANRTVMINSAAPAVVTLPAATGTGNKYRFVVGVAATATETTIKVANTTDVMRGYVFAVTTSSDNAEAFKTTATSDSIELNGTTKGGVAGDVYELTDVQSGIWSVLGFSAPTGSEATPFDATV